MKRPGPIKRKSWMPRVNRKRLARRRALQFGPQAELCRKSPCCIPGCRRRRSDPAHVVSTGAGGKDRGNVVPLCRPHHDQQHLIGVKTFQRKHGLDLAAIAAELEVRAYGGSR